MSNCGCALLVQKTYVRGYAGRKCWTCFDKSEWSGIDGQVTCTGIRKMRKNISLKTWREEATTWVTKHRLGRGGGFQCYEVRMTTFFCHFPPLICRACRRSTEWRPVVRWNNDSVYDWIKLFLCVWAIKYSSGTLCAVKGGELLDRLSDSNRLRVWAM